MLQQDERKIKPKKLSAKKKSVNVTKLWNKAGKAMQDYYRTLDGYCFGKSKSCTGRATVMHHHIRWGQSKILRLDAEKLIPLCKECHCSYHKGHDMTGFNYRSAMEGRFGNNWEQRLHDKNQRLFKMPKKDEIMYLNNAIQAYNDMIEDN